MSNFFRSAPISNLNTPRHLKTISTLLIHNYNFFHIIMSKVNDKLAKLRKNWLHLPLDDCVIEGNAFVGWGKTFSNWCTTGALQRTSVTLRHLITQYMSGAVDYFYLEKKYRNIDWLIIDHRSFRYSENARKNWRNFPLCQWNGFKDFCPSL